MTDQVNLLRQQVILSQVRIMELEDVRDELAPRVTELEQLLASAQTFTDQKLDEAAHLTKVLADLQIQFEHMRHMQHVTNSALEESRSRLSTAEQAITASSQARTELLLQIGHANERLLDLERLRQQAQDESNRHQHRAEQFNEELRRMKASRSWRWTACLRTLEHAFSRRKS